MNKVQPQVNQAISLCLLLLCLGNQGFAQESPGETESLAEKRETLTQELDSLRSSLASADRLSKRRSRRSLESSRFWSRLIWSTPNSNHNARESRS